VEEVVQIVQRLVPELGEPDGDPVALAGGITNRNYLVAMGGRRYVIRVPGKDTALLGIDRRAERIANERAAAAAVAPPVVAFLDDPECIVTVFVEGSGMEASDLRSDESLFQVARSLRAIHDSEEILPGTFNSFRIVEEYAAVASERGAKIPSSYESAQARAAEIEEALTGPEHEPVPCHNDLLAGNFISGSDQLWIVDWEYAGMGDRYFDLANFSVNNELGDAEQRKLLSDYGLPDRVAGLRLMIFMSDFREAMWGVVQSAVSDLDFDFTGYADQHFARLLETSSDPSFDRRLEEARGAQG
jgi:thiamine kinase-like enzyme